MKLTKNRLMIVAGIPVFLLLVALFASIFSKAFNWGFLDYLVASILLFGCSLSIHFFGLKLKNSTQKIVAISLIVMALLLVWVELAVGLFGSPFAGS